MYRLIRPLLFSLDPETAHQLTLRVLGAVGRWRVGRWLIRASFAHADPRLAVDAFGIRFRNPLGLAAGYDKNGIALAGLGAMGFGFVEAGTVTCRPQAGNPRPRVFRLPEDEALINRMGFPNEGVERLLENLRNDSGEGCALGINIGKGRDVPLESAADDYARLLRLAYPHADYLAVNVSSPNTPGLRGLQSRDALGDLLARLMEERAALVSEHGRRVPLLLKIAPDLTEGELDDVVDLALATDVDGLIATNTTLARDGLRGARQGEAGGLSGRPLTRPTTAIIGHVYRATGGRLPIVGVGGVMSAEDAVEKIRAGATLIQVYTGLVYRGPWLVRDIGRGLARAVEALGLRGLGEMVGMG